jgi:two-component system, NtrC family, nitrogen regulation sensor histidine kinase NtrY
MIFNKSFQSWIVVRVLLLLITLTAAAYFFVNGWYLPLALLSPVICFQVIEFLRYQRRLQNEIKDFVEAVHYRDFSRHFDVTHAPAEMQDLRKAFNEINNSFKLISKEKETQYQYLQKILELVDTGILSYETGSGEVVWMNETIKKMLQIPYLKSIHALSKRDTELYEEVNALKPGEVKIATAKLEKTSFKLLLSATAFQTEGKTYKLIAFQNVNEALEQTESKAWQKLLSVMTHEIMNSIAPISSLADTLKTRLATKDSHTFEDLEIGIDTIKKRSEGLLKFAATYRNLNKITTLNRQRVYLRELFANLNQLMQPTFEEKNIELDIILRDTDLSIHADVHLMEQVLINLIVNAIEAVKDQAAPVVTLSAEQDLNNKILIRVADNGTGIEPEVLDKIFIPFFSTKKNGSGIGLSLCKQIIALHKGTLQVNTVQGKGTLFIISLD